ncbi:ArpU family phage packaging/lysis transcriptional regulator [Companilactobacillus musae]|uniref:ArpU family phage packaging/lysis transcriptional regulator n=1 Tax=Companilactobacillus musae TaxID=1903258 RepID=UPI0013C2EEDB|nr:ArpU family phage packaging/lysis transcriptional regulator [Companilactobacillus musae]
MYLLPEIDSKKTKKNARRVLNPYRNLARISGLSLTDTKSPAITGMPRNNVFGNSKEIKNVNVISAIDEIEEIEKAVSNLSRECMEVIYYTYMSKELHTKIDIAGLVFGSINANKTVERRLSEGLLQFAEAYRGGRLLSFKNQENCSLSLKY